MILNAKLSVCKNCFNLEIISSTNILNITTELVKHFFEILTNRKILNFHFSISLQTKIQANYYISYVHLHHFAAIADLLLPNESVTVPLTYEQQMTYLTNLNLLFPHFFHLKIFSVTTWFCRKFLRSKKKTFFKAFKLS